MDCPICKNSPMIVLELDEVEVDYCQQCSGIWLDAGELEILLGQTDLSVSFLNSFKPAKHHSEDIRKCPICLKKMQKISIGNDKEKVIIDKCTKNHGLWFDKGELGQVLEKGSLDKENKIQKLLCEMFRQEF